MTSQRVNVAALTSVLSAALLLSACAGPAPSEGGSTGDLTPITVGYLPIAYGAAVKLGDEQGIFEKHGLEIVYGKPAATGAGQITQLLNGELEVAMGSATGVMSAVASDIPVRIVSAVDHDFDVDGQGNNGTFVAADSGIERFADLEGRTVGMNSLQGNWEIAVREAVEADGGDGSAVIVTQIPFAEAADAVAQGRVDAVLTIQPFAAALLDAGFTNLGNTQVIATGDPEVANAVAFMTQAFIDSKPEVAEAWVAALTEASQYANDHPAEVREVIARETGTPAELLDRAPLPAFGTGVNETTLAKWADLLVQYGIFESVPPVSEVVWDGAPRV